MKKLALHWQILIGMAAGVIFALLLSNFDWGPGFISDWIKPFGTIFINALKLIAVLIFSFCYYFCFIFLKFYFVKRSRQGLVLPLPPQWEQPWVPHTGHVSLSPAFQPAPLLNL